MANAFAERWIGTIRRELLDRTIIWNQRQLERVVVDYIGHYNSHRHRSLDQRPSAGSGSLQRTHQRVSKRSLTSHDAIFRPPQATYRPPQATYMRRNSGTPTEGTAQHVPGEARELLIVSKESAFAIDSL